jgi:hypothetical protein
MWLLTRDDFCCSQVGGVVVRASFSVRDSTDCDARRSQRSLGLDQLRQYRRDGLVGREIGGLNCMAGEAEVDGVAGLEPRLRSAGVGEDGARLAEQGGGGFAAMSRHAVAGRAAGAEFGIERLHHAAVEEDREWRVEKDGGGAGGLLEEQAIGEDLRRAAAQREDDVVAAEGGCERLRLDMAEVRLAVRGEDGGNGHGGAGFNEGVEVEEVPAEACREEAAGRGLAGAHEAGENESAVTGKQSHGVDRGEFSRRDWFGGRDVHFTLPSRVQRNGAYKAKPRPLGVAVR